MRILRRKSKRKRLPLYLSQQIHYAITGVNIARYTCQTDNPGQDLRDEMNQVEHAGDETRRDLIEAMSGTLTTHLEREDIFRISRSIDDVLDNLRDFVREVILWDSQLDQYAIDALDSVEKSLKHLDQAVTITSLEHAATEAREAANHAKTLRRSYQEALATLFSEELTMNTLRKRESMRRIDVIGLRLQEASGAILDGLIKRSL